MSHLFNIIKKEVKELLTPGSVISIAVVIVLFMGLGGFIGGEIEKSAVLPVVGVGNYEGQSLEFDDGEWNVYDAIRGYYTSQGMTKEMLDASVVKIDMGSIKEDIERYNVTCAFILDDSFKSNIENGIQGAIHQYYVYSPSGMINGSISTAVSDILIQAINTDLSNHLMGPDEVKKNISFLVNPIVSKGTHTFINGQEYTNVTPAQLSEAMSSQTIMIPMIIMIIIMMIGSMVISSMGSEKENKTLETLLTLPIKRTTIVSGKIIAAAIVGLVYGIAYMVGLSFYLNSVMSISGSSSVDLSKYGLALDTFDFVLLTLSMFLAIVCALGICMTLGAFAKNYKSAQTMTLPISLLAIIPMFITMFSGWYGSSILMKTILFVIPFSHPMLASEALLNDDYTLVFAGIAYMVVFALVGILITVRLYKSDILITGLSQNKYIQMMRGKKN